VTSRTKEGTQVDKWSFSDIDVIRGEELHLPTTTPADWFHDYDHPELEPHLGWLEPRFAEHDSGRMVGSVHTWAVRTANQTILIDTGVGNGKVPAGLGLLRGPGHELTTRCLVR